MQTFADRAREVMAERGLGSNELNRAMGKGMGFVSGLLKKKSPQIETMQLLAEALGVHLEWLTSGKGPRYLEETTPTPPPISSGTRHKTFKDLPGWPEAERKARARYRRVPPIAWTGAGLFMSETPPEVIDESTVYAFAQAWLAGATESHREAAAEAEGRAAMAEEDAAYERKLAKLTPKAEKKVAKR